MSKFMTGPHLRGKATPMPDPAVQPDAVAALAEALNSTYEATSYKTPQAFAADILAALPEGWHLTNYKEVEADEYERCPTCMQPVPMPQRGDHDYGLSLIARNSDATQEVEMSVDDFPVYDHARTHDLHFRPELCSTCAALSHSDQLATQEVERWSLVPEFNYRRAHMERDPEGSWVSWNDVKPTVDQQG